MKECLYYKKLKENNVQCQLCPRFCVIKEGLRGNCGVRANKNGILYSLVYGKPVSARADPIEKKPLFHFLPGTKSYSIGTAGCNLHCLYCQNWEISQCRPEEAQSLNLTPEQIVKNARKENCKSIAFTYTEPTVFYEYMLDIAKLAKKEGIKTILVNNGYINEGPLKELCKYISAANIDLKAFTDKFYKDICSGSLKPVLNSLKILKKKKVWLEITNLIISGKNDNMEEIEKMCRWVRKELGKETPLHFSRAFPMYKLLNIDITPEKTLLNAKNIADKYLDYVYIGNIKTIKGDDSYCPKCKELAIERDGYLILQNNLIKGKCKCGEKVPGVWE